RQFARLVSVLIRGAPRHSLRVVALGRAHDSPGRTTGRPGRRHFCRGCLRSSPAATSLPANFLRTASSSVRAALRTSSPPGRLAARAALLRHLLALLAGLRQPDRDRLLAALHPAAVACLAAPERAAFAPLHGAPHVLRCRAGISAGHDVSPA